MQQEVVQAITDTISNMISDIHTSMPAKVASYNPSTGLAKITPIALYKKPDGTTIPYPDVTGVPVVHPQCMGQSATIAYPVSEGDGCLLIISEQSLEYWLFERETDAELGHDITNGIAIVGMFTKGNAVMEKACEEKAIIINVKGSYISVNEEKITVVAPLVEVVADTMISLTAPDVIVDGNLSVTGNEVIAGNQAVVGSVSASSCNLECKC